jgi:hypothetical protein
VFNNELKRKTVIKVTPEEVRDRMLKTIVAFMNRAGIGHEVDVTTLGPTCDAVIVLDTALNRDTRVVRVTTFYHIERGASDRTTVKVLLQSWYVGKDSAMHGVHTTTASERSATQKLFNIVHDEVNGFAETLGVLR